MEMPEYYDENGISPIECFERGLLSKEEYKGFIKGNIIKYIVRAGKKESTVADLLKAKSYINFYLMLFLMENEDFEKLENEQNEIHKLINEYF